MNKKILGIILVIAVVVVTGIVYLVYQGYSKNGAEGIKGENIPGEGENTGIEIPQGEEQSGGQTEGQISEQTAGEDINKGSIDKMNDEAYIEIMAQTGYYVQKNATNPNPIAYVSYMKALYGKYGTTVEGFTAYAEKLEKNPDHFAYLNAKYAQRLQELLATGE